MAKNKEVDALLDRHNELTHTNDCKVESHVQRRRGEWFINTLMIEGYDVPFRYKRKQQYRSLQGAKVNLTYYATRETVAGMHLEVMNVVRIKRS